MEIYIKNMVCNRCIMVVSGIFSNAGFPNARVQMGKVTIDKTISHEKLNQIQPHLNEAGFEIISDAKSRLIEQIKKLSIRFVYEYNGEFHENFSHYLSSNLNYDYNYLSSLYSSVEGTTIEKHLIKLKIERVKELLVYDEKTLSEIAYEMGYSSVAHLSGQFKKVTGFTTSYFKQLRELNRKSLDEI